MTDGATRRVSRANVAAIILAGGRASRLGGIDKTQLVVGGARLLDHAVDAVAWCDPVVVVGPVSPVRADVMWARESPAFGGPVAAIAAGLARLDRDRDRDRDRDEVCLLAADTPRAVDAVALLREHPLGAADGVCLLDAIGHAQWLIGRYRAAALRTALGGLPDAARDASIRSLVADLRLDVVPAGALASDIDTREDLERARARFSESVQTEDIQRHPHQETT